MHDWQNANAFRGQGRNRLWHCRLLWTNQIRQRLNSEHPQQRPQNAPCLRHSGKKRLTLRISQNLRQLRSVRADTRNPRDQPDPPCWTSDPTFTNRRRSPYGTWRPLLGQRSGPPLRNQAFKPRAHPGNPPPHRYQQYCQRPITRRPGRNRGAQVGEDGGEFIHVTINNIDSCAASRFSGLRLRSMRGHQQQPCCRAWATNART